MELASALEIPHIENNNVIAISVSNLPLLILSSIGEFLSSVVTTRIGRTLEKCQKFREVSGLDARSSRLDRAEMNARTGPDLGRRDFDKCVVEPGSPAARGKFHGVPGWPVRSATGPAPGPASAHLSSARRGPRRAAVLPALRPGQRPGARLRRRRRPASGRSVPLRDRAGRPCDPPRAPP